MEDKIKSVLSFMNNAALSKTNDLLKELSLLKHWIFNFDDMRESQKVLIIKELIKRIEESIKTGSSFWDYDDIIKLEEIIKNIENA